MFYYHIFCHIIRITDFSYYYYSTANALFVVYYSFIYRFFVYGRSNSTSFFLLFQYYVNNSCRYYTLSFLLLCLDVIATRTHSTHIILNIKCYIK
jgi:hypothetical protein